MWSWTWTWHLEWFLKFIFSCRAFVASQYTLPRKAFVAFITTIWCLFCVNNHVASESFFVLEILITDITVKRSCITVDCPHVILQVISISKSLLTYLTFNFGFPTMNFHVKVKIIFFCKTFLTDITLVRFLCNLFRSVTLLWVASFSGFPPVRLMNVNRQILV